MHHSVDLGTARDMVILAMRAKLVPFLHGSPAIGKSAIVKQIAADHNLELIDIRLSQCDPTDLNGFPSPDKEHGKSTYLPMDMCPLDKDPLPKGKDGWLIFLDELNAADRATTKASYKLLLDHMVGMARLHPRACLVAAGNLATDNALIEDDSTAMQSRMVHIEVHTDTDQFIPFAQKAGFDYRITSFLQFRPDLLYTFKPDHTDYTYGSPRTWEFTDRLLKIDPQMSRSTQLLLGGTLSQGVAREFIVFCEIEKTLTSFESIMTNPTFAKVPSEPGTLYALTGMLAAKLAKGLDKLPAAMKYISRLPAEFQVCCLRDLIRREPIVVASPEISTWIRENGTELF